MMRLALLHPLAKIARTPLVRQQRPNLEHFELLARHFYKLL